MRAILHKLFVGEFSIKRVLRSLILIPIAVYFGLFFLAWFFPYKLLFRPQPSLYRDDQNIIKLSTYDGQKISAKFYPNENARYTILFSHGNAEDIGSIESFAANIRDSGFSVLTYDYRGYGTSDGSPSEKKSYADIQAAYEYLVNTKQVSPDRIILHGRSLGGGPSTELASKNKVAGLILESTFTSAGRVLTNFRLFPFDIFDNLSKLQNVTCPILVIHGKKDKTISFQHGETLFNSARSPKKYLWLDKAGHNNVFSVGRDAYLDSLKSFAAILNN